MEGAHQIAVRILTLSVIFSSKIHGFFIYFFKPSMRIAKTLPLSPLNMIERTKVEKEYVPFDVYPLIQMTV